MSHFTYFVENAPTKIDYTERGLAYVFGDRQPAFAQAPKGPTDGPGMLLSLASDQVRYWPSDQEWLDRGDGVWIGYATASPPTPRDLERKILLPGESIKLCDGITWLVPRLREFFGEGGFATALPTRARRQRGEWINGPVLPEFATADTLGAELLDRMVVAYQTTGLPDAPATMTFAEAFDFAARVLALNYRVSADELGLLGSLPRDPRLAKLLRIATDYDAAENFALKKLQALDA